MFSILQSPFKFRPHPNCGNEEKERALKARICSTVLRIYSQVRMLGCSDEHDGGHAWFPNIKSW